MPIPDFQSAMLPILKLTADGRDHRLAEGVEAVAREFKTTEEELNQLLPSGRQRLIYNRVGWAKTYLQKAGLIEANGRGRYRITSRGKDALKANPNRIDMEFLKQFPEYNAFATAGRSTTEGADPAEVAAVDVPRIRYTNVAALATPEEQLEASHGALRSNLAQDLLEKVKSCSPRCFEELVVDLLVALGYGGSRKDAGQAVGQSGDEGIDGIIKEDRLGLDLVFMQAKRWAKTVGRPDVQGFSGSLDGKRARKGVFITTSTFSKEAREYVEHIEKKIVLIDGPELARLMIENGVGVTEVATYTVKKMDLDYFEDEE